MDIRSINAARELHHKRCDKPARLRRGDDGRYELYSGRSETSCWIIAASSDEEAMTKAKEFLRSIEEFGKSQRLK